MDELKVYYKTKARINSELDKEMGKLAKRHGLELRGSGFGFCDGERDMHFVRKK